LSFKHFGVIHVMTAKSAAKGETIMKTYTIDPENAISAFATAEEAAPGTTTPFDTFSSRQELADLIAAWPPERIVATWNCLPGVAPVKRFKTSNVAATKIWDRIRDLGEATQPEPAAAKAKAGKKAKGGARAPKVATSKDKAAKKSTAGKKAPKGQKNAAGTARDGSKTAQVVAMLQRNNGASLTEIMEKMGWQKHTVRGFMAGAMKKAGYQVESFKSDKGERTYRIN
jgi:hypothetical protein